MPNRMIQRSGMVLAALSAFLTVGVWGDEAASVADPVLDGRIAKAVEKLGGSRFQEREEGAKELVGIGWPALPALKKAAAGSNAEAAVRAREIAEGLEKTWVPPEIREKIEALRQARSPEGWKKLWDAVQSSGEPAQRALLREIHTPDGEATLAVKGLPDRARRGQPLEFQAVLKNPGKAGLWIAAGCLQVNGMETVFWSAQSAEDEEARIDAEAFLEGTYSLRGFEAAAPEVPYLYIAPGEELEVPLRLEGRELDFVGTCRIRLAYSRWRRKEEGIQEALRKSGLASQDVPRPLERSVSAQSGMVEIIPAMDALARGMALAFAKGSKFEPGPGGIPVKLVLANAGGKPALIPPPMENGKPRGIWYALLDEKGEVRQAGPLAGNPPPTWKADDVVLVPGKAIEASGTIPAAVPPGKYRLVCGYSAHGPRVRALGGTAKDLEALRTLRLKREQDHNKGVMGGAARPAKNKNTRQMRNPFSPSDPDGSPDWTGDAIAPVVEIEVPK